MEIKHNPAGESCMFYIEKDDKKIAVLEYSMSKDNSMNLNHTMVAEELEGQGIGKKLLEEAIAFARENNYKIKANCPFAAAVLQRNEEKYKDVMA